MQQATSRKARKVQTREALKAAALRCFVEQGFHAASIAAITAAAGVAHGTFYVHFASKEALLDELLGEFNAALAAKLAPLWSTLDGRGIPDVVHETARLFLEHWEGGRGFVEVYVQRLGTGLGPVELREGLNPPAAGLLAGGLGHLLERAGGNPADAPLAAQALLGMWLRVGLQHLFHEGLDRARTARTLTRLTLGALQGLVAPDEPDTGR